MSTESTERRDLFDRLGGDWRFWVGLAAALGLLVGAWALWGSGNGEDEAVDVCQQRVADQLKSPSSADFSDVSATELSDGRWTVHGSVDAENSFGASLRQSWSCVAVYEDGDRWSVSASLD